jgi:hypothetical protein
VADQGKVHESLDKQPLCQETSIKKKGKHKNLSSENMKELNEKMEKH